MYSSSYTHCQHLYTHSCIAHTDVLFYQMLGSNQHSVHLRCKIARGWGGDYQHSQWQRERESMRALLKNGCYHAAYHFKFDILGISYKVLLQHPRGMFAYPMDRCRHVHITLQRCTFQGKMNSNSE